MFRTSCRTVRDLLPLHVGRDLDPRKAAAVDEHLHRCLSCFREYREYLDLRGTLGVLAEPPLPEGALDGFVEEVMARVALGEAGPEAPLPTNVVRARWLPRLAAAAAVLLAVSVGYVSWEAAQGGPLPMAPVAGPVGHGADGALPDGGSLATGSLALSGQPVETGARVGNPASAPLAPMLAPRTLATPVSEGTEPLRRGSRLRGGGEGVTIYFNDLRGVRRVLRGAPGLPPGEFVDPSPADDGLMPDPGRLLRPRDPADGP